MAGGRPTKYDPEYHPRKAKQLCEMGATMKQLADFFDVSISSVELWAVTHEEFSRSIKVGKDVADDKVEASLYHRAMGYSHPETIVKVVDKELVEVEVMKHYPPDTSACIYWTRNRRPKKWRNNPENSGSEGDSLAESVSKLIDKLPG